MEPDALVARCLDHLRTTGLLGFSIAELASSVSLSKSGLYASFGSKESLQLAVVTEARRQFTAQVVAPSLLLERGVPRIWGISRAWTAWADVPGGCPFVAWAAELDDRVGPLRDAVVATQKDWTDFLQNACRIAIDEGHFRADLDAEAWAFRFYALHMGFHMYERLLRHPRSEALREASVDQLLQQAASPGTSVSG
ncbi:MAG: TetR family transcriptional regulator [Myxococcales bacterium]|nr:TetR family transcriptional regulator [Myxococcales bacterium]